MTGKTVEKNRGPKRKKSEKVGSVLSEDIYDAVQPKGELKRNLDIQLNF